MERDYKLFGTARSGHNGPYHPSNRQYLSFASYDIDKKFIDLRNVYRYPGSTDTQLATALNQGNTQIHLQNATGWYQADRYYYRNIIWYPYQDSTGHIYPDYTYSQNKLLNGWDENKISGNVITLKKDARKAKALLGSNKVIIGTHK